MFPSEKEALLNKKFRTDSELVDLARETKDWRSLYDVFCMLLAEKKKLSTALEGLGNMQFERDNRGYSFQLIAQEALLGHGKSD